MGFRYVSIFSGVEAASLAWEPLGWEPVAFSEIEPFPCAVLAERWPDVPNLGDITKIDWKEKIDGAIDLVVGGSNLQTYVCETAHSGSNGLGVGEADIFPTLDTSSGPAVWARENAVRPPFGFAQNVRNEVRIVGDGTLNGALAANPGMKQTTFVCTGGTYPINEQIATRDKKLGCGTGLGVGADGDSAFTLLANHPHMVASGSESGPIAMGDAIEKKSMGSNPMLIRRLTPLECERLQGFPDEHTLIAWKGKSAGECPDGPRYKAIGNSMAVPVMRWIGRRIAAADTD